MVSTVHNVLVESGNSGSFANIDMQTDFLSVHLSDILYSHAAHSSKAGTCVRGPKHLNKHNIASSHSRRRGISSIWAVERKTRRGISRRRNSSTPKCRPLHRSSSPNLYLPDFQTLSPTSPDAGSGGIRLRHRHVSQGRRRIIPRCYAACIRRAHNLP